MRTKMGANGFSEATTNSSGEEGGIVPRVITPARKPGRSVPAVLSVDRSRVRDSGSGEAGRACSTGTPG